MTDSPRQLMVGIDTNTRQEMKAHILHCYLISSCLSIYANRISIYFFFQPQIPLPPSFFVSLIFNKVYMEISIFGIFAVGSLGI